MIKKNYFGIFSSVIAVFGCWSQIQGQEAFKLIPVTFRDFDSSSTDFEKPNCRADGINGRGMVQDTLGPDHKPFSLPSNNCGDPSKSDYANVHNWFQDSIGSAGPRARYCKTLPLGLNAVAGSPGQYGIDKNNFFPLDSVPTNTQPMKAIDSNMHNFHFCMEMHATFKYKGNEIFKFKGDDDLWVFVNNKLALDLGGLNNGSEGSINLDQQKNGLKIELGSYYNFDLFYCERQTTGSNLTMSTSIDIIPPPAAGLHIADTTLNVLHSGDTLDVPIGSISKIFKSVEFRQITQDIDCNSVTSQIKILTPGTWLLNNVPLGTGPIASAAVNSTGLAPGVYKLVLDNGGVRDSVWIKVDALPTVGTPVATPASTVFKNSQVIALSDTTLGAEIHYTTDGTIPTALSPIYTAPISITASTVIKAIGTKPLYNPSPVMIESFTRLFTKALAGYYQDLNGDGMIETAVILFDSNYIAPPTAVNFVNPFVKTSISPALSSVPAIKKVTYTLTPFTLGTTFPPQALANVGADSNYTAQSVVMYDSVGPVIISVKSIPSDNPAIPPRIEVEFSEPVTIDVAGKVFPIEIKRNALPVNNAEVIVANIKAMTPKKYSYEFAAGSKYPVPGDSARIDPVRPVMDASGNPSRMTTYIRVVGEPLNVTPKIDVAVEIFNPKSPRIIPALIPNVIVVHGNKTCVNCNDPGIAKVLPTQLPAELSKVGPSILVNSKYPFHYSVTLFDNVGQFVNKSSGEISPVQFSQLRLTESKGDSVLVKLTFLPISDKGNLIGTGAYIMKVEITIHNQLGSTGPQGEPVKISAPPKLFTFRVGYIRPH